TSGPAAPGSVGRSPGGDTLWILLANSCPGVWGCCWHRGGRSLSFPVTGGGVVSLRPEEWPEIPEVTARVARAAAGRGVLPMAMRVRDELGGLFADAEFAEAVSGRGR